MQIVAEFTLGSGVALAQNSVGTTLVSEHLVPTRVTHRFGATLPGCPLRGHGLRCQWRRGAIYSNAVSGPGAGRSPRRRQTSHLTRTSLCFHPIEHALRRAARGPLWRRWSLAL